VTVLSEKYEASGHPSVEPRGRFLITDDHPQHGSQQHVILRLLDLKADTDRVLCTLPTVFRPSLSTTDLRLDGHPVWNRDFTQCCLQATHEGRRQLFIVDLKEHMI
jgi:hypothetical protein